MGISEWWGRQWQDIRGNVKFYVGGVLLTAVITGATALTHGLALWQQVCLVLLFVLVILIAVWWRFPSSSIQAGMSKDGVAVAPISPLLTTSSPLVPSRPATAKEIDLHIEVLDTVFKEHLTGSYGALFGGRDGWYMLFRLRITNRGTSDATVTKWEFQPVVGRGKSWLALGTTSVMQIPTAWYIEKSPTHYGAAPIRIEIERPTLDQLVEREPLKPRIPQTGWILFDLINVGSIFGPHNAEYDFELHDSMGGIHKHEEFPKWTEKSGEIKSEPSPEELAAKSLAVKK